MRRLFALLAISLCFASTSFTQQATTAADPAVTGAVTRAREANLQNRPQDAIKILRSLPKEQLNQCFDCNVALAVALSNTNKQVEAADAATHAISLAGDPTQRSLSLRLRGSIYAATQPLTPQVLSNAETDFRSSLELNPKDDTARYLLGYTLLRENRDADGKQVLTEFLNTSPADSQLHKAAELLVAQPRRARERFAPNFDVTTAQGEHLSLAALKGKVVVLDFWATWCPPCRESVPELKELSHKYSRDKLVLLSISADDDHDQWQKFVARKQMDWPQYFDEGHQVAKLFDVHAFPTYMIIDGDGAIVKELSGLDPRQTVAARIKDQLKTMKELE